jgi:hypothetical protein
MCQNRGTAVRVEPFAVLQGNLFLAVTRLKRHSQFRSARVLDILECNATKPCCLLSQPGSALRQRGPAKRITTAKDDHKRGGKLTLGGIPVFV